MANPPLHTSDQDIVNIYNMVTGISAIGGGTANFTYVTMGESIRDVYRPGFRLEVPGQVGIELYVDYTDNRLHIWSGDVTFEQNAYVKGGNPWCDVKGYGAKGDGATDDSTAIQAAINTTITAGGGTVFFPAGTYIMSPIGGNTSNVTFMGAGRDVSILKVKSGVTGATLLNFQNRPTITLKDLTLNGNGATNVNLVDAGSGGTGVVSGLVVSNVRFTNVNGTVLVATGRTNMLVDGCFLDSISGSYAGGIVNFASSSATRPARIVLTRNVFTTVTNPAVAASMNIGRADYVAVANNVIYNADSPCAMEHCTQYTLSGNVVNGTIEGLRVANADTNISSDVLDYYATITGNTVLGCTAESGIIVRGNNITIAGNVSKGNARAGIDMSTGRSAVSLNPFTAKKVVVTGNDCTGNTLDGILMATNIASAGSLTNVRVVGNNLSGNTRNGVYMQQNTAGDFTNVVIAENDLTGNGSGAFGGDYATVAGQAGVAYRNNLGFNPQGVAAISVTASPFTYTNNDGVPEAIYIYGGTVSQVAKNSVNLFGQTNVTVWLEPGESTTVTYSSSAPTMAKDRK